MKLVSVVRTLRWSLKQRGVQGTICSAMAAVQRRRGIQTPERVHPFDQQFGTDTGGVISGGKLAVGSRNDAFITAYAGVAPSRLRASLDRWQATLGDKRMEEFAFVDLGCGKGRALLLAAERPFREVLGVELNPELARIAQANIALWRAHSQTAPPVAALCGDATEITFPPGPCLVFIYNAFGPPVVRAVLDSLERHVRATGEWVDLLFQNEGAEMPLRGDGRLQLLWTAHLALDSDDASADPVASPEDVTSLYRWVG